jgi:hypothetical protein
MEYQISYRLSGRGTSVFFSSGEETHRGSPDGRGRVAFHAPDEGTRGGPSVKMAGIMPPGFRGTKG